MAQKQHYVPKFILRHFLSDAEKEQVSVYDKHEDRVFLTSLENIMAENCFHDLSFQEVASSFEPIASKIEELVLPTYRRIIAQRKLSHTIEERGALSYLMAFQFVRTKGFRHFFDDVDNAIKARAEPMGYGDRKIEGWIEPTETNRKQRHLTTMLDSINRYAPIIASKDFFLIEAGDGRSFYLGDNPVALHNDRQFGPYGNLGFAVPGIQIYMPLSSDLSVAAWCPSILAERQEKLRKVCEKAVADEMAAGSVLLTRRLEAFELLCRDIEGRDGLFSAFKFGTPLSSSKDNMDFYNSSQSRSAYRFVISSDANFDIAQRHNAEFPKFRTGHRPRVD